VIYAFYAWANCSDQFKAAAFDDAHDCGQPLLVFVAAHFACLTEISQVKDPTEMPAGTCPEPRALSGSTHTIRVFFALWPAPAIQQQLLVIAEEYQATFSARMMRAETLHLTLQFIGNIKRAQLPALLDAANKITGIRSFRLELDTLAFWKHNHIGYVTSSSLMPSLDKLAAALRQTLTEQKFIRDSSGILDSPGFSPHVTLFRNVRHIPAPQHFTPVAWQVNALVLVESVTAEQGTEYRILHEWPFAG